MSQTPNPSAQDPAAWCAAVQAKLMAALDAAWAVIDAGADPAAVALAHAKARACGQLAATARKIATMVPAAPATRARSAPMIPTDLLARLEAAAADAKPPAAQAVAMRAALKKLGRRGR